jgi:cobalt/nickel transport system permease protein
VSHLHLPDGALPWWLWAPGLVLAAIVIAIVNFRRRHTPRDRLALLGSLAALMLAAMSIPLGPLGYHLSLAPVVGIVLGSGLAFVAAFVVNLVLALLGHGGFTALGLNALVTGIATTLASVSYRAWGRGAKPFWPAAAAAACGLLVSHVAWLVIVGLAGVTPNPGEHAHAGEHAAGLVAAAGATREAWMRLLRFAALSSPFWIVGTLTEAMVAGGVISFLAKVDPGLIEGAPEVTPGSTP